MDGNALISAIQNGLSIDSSAVSAVVGALITTIFLRRDTSVQEFEKVKAGMFEDVIESLLKSGKMSYMEFYKCKNFLQIAKIADRIYKEEYSDSGEKETEHDFDWFARFFEYASNIGNEGMQLVWGAIMAGEINAPGKTSFSLLHALFMMRKDQINLFSEVCKFSMLDIEDLKPQLFVYLATHRDMFKRRGITPSSLKELERLGLVECDFKNGYIFENKKILRAGNKQITIYGNPSDFKKVKVGNAKLTEDGYALYSMIDGTYKKYRADYVNFIIECLHAYGCKIYVNGKLLE